MRPDVSVIIPVYNSAAYVREAIGSVRDQTMDPQSVELVVVDDGSTDGSGAILEDLAAEDPRMTLITQENSGTPGGARNPALDRASGRFVFFLDSDDQLTPDALRRMVEVADAEGSDVVLGKMASSDDRHAPATMFRRTVLDADLVKDKVFNTLGPTKLIRRELIERLGLRFPRDQRVGEDQPFMAAVYLTATKISILADMDYYIVRHRADGSNLTLKKQPAAAQVEIAVRLARTVERYTESGERRDALLKRPLGWSLGRALDTRWLSLEEEEQVELADRVRAEIGHLVTDGVRARLAPAVRIKLDLLLAGDLDALRAFTAYLSEGPGLRVAWSEGAFRMQLPDEIARLVPGDGRAVPTPKMSCRLEGLAVDGTAVTVSASVRVADLDGAPDSLTLRARRRSDDSTADFTTTAEDCSPGSATFAITGEHPGLQRGVWDMVVVVRFGAFEKEIRLGADRAGTIEPEGASNLGDDPAPADRVLAYFTRGPGNLSIDRGAVLHRRLAGATVLGLTVDENGRAVLLVRTTREPRAQDAYFARIVGVRQHGGRQLLPSSRVGPHLVAVRLPVTPELIGATVSVTAALGGPSSPLPVTGTEFWPARAAGFGLRTTRTGAVRVIHPRDSARRGESEQSGPTHAAGRSRRRRAVERVRSAPVIGPVGVAIARRMRRRHP